MGFASSPPQDGKRHGIWRKAANRTEARKIIPAIIASIGTTSQHPRGFVYAMQMQVPGTEHGPVKIGFSVSVYDRLGAQTTHSPYPVRVIGFWETEQGIREGRELHAKFAASKLRGEWFEATPDLLETVKTRTESYRNLLNERTRELSQLIESCDSKCQRFVTAA